MHNVVTVYHRGSVEEDDFGNIRFVGMQRVPMLFVGRPMFAEVVARSRDQIHCNSNEGELTFEGVLHYGKSSLTYHRRNLPIACQDDWENYVNGVMMNEIQLIDLPGASCHMIQALICILLPGIIAIHLLTSYRLKKSFLHLPILQ